MSDQQEPLAPPPEPPARSAWELIDEELEGCDTAPMCM